jgi:hypothetical protein
LMVLLYYRCPCRAPLAEQSAVRRWRWLPGSGVAGGLAVALRL